MTLKLMVRRELAALLTLQPSTRPWQLPFAATMASGAPMLAGAASGQPALGALGAIAGLSFLYLPPVRLFQRIPIMMACAFAMVTSYGVGALGAMTPGMAVPLIGVVAILAMLFCKFYSLSPPGPIFMVMAAAIAAFTPTDAGHSFQHIGYFALGAAWACAVAIAYSVAIAGRQQPARAVLRPIADKGAALADSVITGIFVGVALLVALALQLEKPYWVPISCLAVIQGVTLRASWNRNIHRIVGTFIGLGLVWLLLPFVRDPWTIAAMVIVLTFIIETVVVRHYAFAAIFITPLTILLAEGSGSGVVNTRALMEARLIDTVVGAMIGLLGAYCLHHPGLRSRIGRGVLRPRPLRNQP